jgi:hypothetical protein
MNYSIPDSLYDLLAAIVDSHYSDPVRAVQQIIPNQINTIFELFEALPIDIDRRSRMRDNEMQYMMMAKKEFEVLNNEGNYDDIELLQTLINRFFDPKA